MERIQNLVYTHVQGGQFRWVTVSTLMLALGTILHLVSPSVAGVTPNWTIATYCVAILLTRPSLSQTLGIGLVAALINVLTSKSAFPYGNLLSEPGGALTAALVTRAMLSVKFRKIGGFDLTPVVSGFLATVVSGGIFVTILWQVLGLPNNVYMYGMWPLVLIVGALNGAITPILYIPAQRLFSKRGMLPNADQLTSDHSRLTILPERQAKISIEHVNYYHPKATTPSLENINLDVNEGDFLVVTGPAGCGKSTLCMAMVGAVPKFYGGRLEGMVFVDGHATTQMEIPELANHIGVVLADYDTQLVTMTVREEVAFAMENRGYDRETIKARSEEVFKQVGLVGDLNQKHGITVVVIDHDLHAVLPYANRMALMVDGSIACDDDVPTTLRYMYEHNIHVDALPSVFTTYMELEQAGFHSDEPWLSIESAIKGLHQIEMAHAIQTEVHGKSNSPANQRITVDNLVDQSNIVENRQPVQRVDDVPGKDGGAHA